jgi:hypothetical protein
MLMREHHLERVSTILSSSDGISQPARAGRLRRALETWEAHRLNGSENFWQKLFEERPELLIPISSGRPYVLNKQCYVGGKSVGNQGGLVPDFLVQCSGNAVLVELKNPTADLVGVEYRQGIYAPSSELVGACVQALEYRMSLMNHLHSLRFQTPDLSAHSPTAVVIIGDSQARPLSEHQRRSFEIFRNSLKDVTVTTFDELFLGIENLAAMLDVDVVDGGRSPAGDCSARVARVAND